MPTVFPKQPPSELPHWSKYPANGKGSGFGNLAQVGRQAFSVVASHTISFRCSAQVQLWLESRLILIFW